MSNRLLLASRRGKAKTIAVALIAVAGLGAIVVMSTRKGEQTASNTTTADRYVASEKAFEVTTTANGELEARNKVEIRNPMERESTILEIISEGQRVKKGDVLIKINAEDLLTKIEEEQAKVKSELAQKVSAENAYEIQLNENNTKLQQAQLDLEVARLTLNQWRLGDDLSKRLGLDLAVQSATVELERLADRYLKSQELCEQEFLSRDERDRDEVTYIQTISEYRKAQLSRDTYITYESPKEEKSKASLVDKAISELERVRLNNQIELQDKGSKRDIAIDQHKAAERRLKRLEDQFNSATIVAPQDGLVVYGTSVDRNRWGDSEGPLQIGQRISPNQLLFILPDTSEMVAAIRVHESLAGRIRPGMATSVKVDAAGGAVYPGRIESIGVMAETGGWRDPNLREYTVRIAMDIGEAQLKPSMRCEAKVIIESVPETLAVPVQAVFSDGPVRFVYQNQGQKFSRVPVKLGRRSDTTAEILAGIAAGDQVLLRDPSAGEVLSEPWDPQRLTLAGYKLGPDGKPASAEGSGRPGRARGADAPAPATPPTAASGEKPAAPAADGGKPLAPVPTRGKPATDSKK
ncbi:MAG: efflux RND transporter periplasmic adaptor subunit [Phycisphaerales bacterium]